MEAPRALAVWCRGMKVDFESHAGRRTWPWALIAASVIACSGSAEAPSTRLRDTTGAHFEFATERADALESVEGLATECGDKQLAAFRFLRGKTGLAMVCGIDPSSQTAADYLCRPVACDQTADCPEGWGCNQGLCQCQTVECRELDGGGRIHSLELMARCLHAIPRFPRCLQAFTDPSWALVSQVLLAECDAEGLCTVPDTCR